jgi:hypothetical protein
MLTRISTKGLCSNVSPAVISPLEGERLSGRVAPPFGFALTDPHARLSRIRLFPKVTPRSVSRGEGMSDPKCRKRKALQQRNEAAPDHPTLAPTPQGTEPDSFHLPR